MESKITFISLAVSILLSFLLARFILQNNAKTKEIERLNRVIQNQPQRESEIFVDSLVIPVYRDSIIEHQQIKLIEREAHRSITESSIPTTYADSIAKALKIGTSEIERLTKVNAKLQGKLDNQNLVIEDLKANEIRWKNRYIDVVTNLTDSTINYTYNADISVIDYEKREKWYKAKKHYTALTSSDPNFRINGVQRYEKLIDVKCPSVKFGVQSGYGAVYIDNNFRLAPYVGVGINFNLFK